jgi:hypothetical protein
VTLSDCSGLWFGDDFGSDGWEFESLRARRVSAGQFIKDQLFPEFPGASRTGGQSVVRASSSAAQSVGNRRIFLIALDIASQVSGIEGIDTSKGHNEVPNLEPRIDVFCRCEHSVRSEAANKFVNINDVAWLCSVEQLLKVFVQLVRVEQVSARLLI